MYLGLFLKKPEIKSGHYPQMDKKYIKEYKNGTIEQANDIGNFFFNNINEECGTLTVPYEYDYWDAKQCKKLVNWISSNQDLIQKANLVESFKIIEEYCKKAIELDTGIEIDL